MRERREAHLSPLRARSDDLREKLKAVDTQLEAAHVAMQNRRRRERSSGEDEFRDANAPPAFDGADEDASPPPYSPYYRH